MDRNKYTVKTKHLESLVTGYMGSARSRGEQAQPINTTLHCFCFLISGLIGR